ncbi:serine/threonine-protein kinase DCLK1 isoform X1 [Aplysia californica]|uniref:non-specific serine/threonine protein kinase n=1 Tax=Aplysia californica TaxID=6500 RepID=A0ABM0JZH7_APLCA|nr:serine/threonine-protein kinase DCLK1 isoform X1 [Aplysia californica]
MADFQTHPGVRRSDWRLHRKEESTSSSLKEDLYTIVQGMSKRVFGMGETTLAGVSKGGGQHHPGDKSDEHPKASRWSPGVSERSNSSKSSFSLAKMASEKRARRVRFYRNGDRFFKGMIYAVSTERFRSFENLLTSLTTSSLCDKRVMPQGVRHIFSADGANRITSLDQLQDGESYVCASNDVFRTLDYSKNEDPDWNRSLSARSQTRETPYYQPNQQLERQSSQSDQHRSSSSQSQHRPGSLAGSRPNSSRAKPSKSEMCPSNSKEYDKYQQSFVTPRLITVIKHGKRPRRAVRLLLNKKTAQSFDQVMVDITEAVKMDSGNVRKLYALSGRQVTCLADFFGEDAVFLACGKEKVSMEDLNLDQREVRQVNAYRPFTGKTRERVTLRRSRNTGSDTESRASSTKRSSDTSDGLARSSDHGSLAPGKENGTETEAKTELGNESEKDDEKNFDIHKILKPVALTNKYEIGALIGTGNFAVVLECKEKKTKRKFALKIINKDSCKGKEKMIDNEVRILRCVKHPNIIRLVEDYTNQHRIFYIMELVRGGDLFDAIASSTKYTEQDASGMLYNLASALDYLHGMHIVHRDVKPENLLIRQHDDGTKSLKLGDFGLATEVKGPLYTVCGTPTYVAPEVIAETGYGVKIDVWSAGVIAYILLCGFPPFSSSSDNQDELFDLILTASYDFPNPYWEGISAPAKNLVKRMLEIDPDKRLSAGQVLQHKWVSSDVIYEADLQKMVSTGLSTFFRRGPRSIPKNAGIQIIATTALDKVSRYFQGRGSPLDKLRGIED